MKDEISKELIEIGKKRPNPNLPQDLYVAIDTFMVCLEMVIYHIMLL